MYIDIRNLKVLKEISKQNHTNNIFILYNESYKINNWYAGFMFKPTQSQSTLFHLPSRHILYRNTLKGLNLLK